MFQNKKRLWEFMGCFLLAVLVFMGIYHWIPAVYSTNDDRMIMELVSGQYTGKPEAYAIQMTFGFTWFLSKLYEITNSLNWYGILLIGIQIFSMGAILYGLQKKRKSGKQKFLILAGWLLVYLILWLQVFVQLTYTTTAAFAGAAAIFLYGISEDSWKDILVIGILVVLSFSIRPNVFYLMLPAAGVIWLSKIIGRKEKKKLTIAVPFLLLSVIGCLFLTDHYANRQGEWKEFREFFDDRTKIYDYYDLLPYDEHPELYDPYHISEEEYHVIRIYDYTLLGNKTKNFFPKYIRAYEEMEKEAGNTPVKKLWNAIKVLGSDLLHNAYGWENTVVLLAAVLLLFYFGRQKEKLLFWQLLIQTGVWTVMWLYFTYWGRTIERIQISMSLILLAVVLGFLTKAQIPEIIYKKQWCVWIFLGVLMLGAMGNFKEYRAYNIQKVSDYQDIQEIKRFCAEDPESVYFMDVASITEQYGICSIRNQDPEYMNYIPLGDWTAYCPHYYEKLKIHDVKNVEEALTEDHTYVIIYYPYQLQCIMDYLGNEYTQQWVRTIFSPNGNSYAVYQIQRSES